MALIAKAVRHHRRLTPPEGRDIAISPTGYRPGAIGGMGAITAMTKSHTVYNGLLRINGSLRAKRTIDDSGTMPRDGAPWRETARLLRMAVCVPQSRRSASIAWTPFEQIGRAHV